MITEEDGRSSRARELRATTVSSGVEHVGEEENNCVKYLRLMNLCPLHLLLHHLNILFTILSFLALALLISLEITNKWVRPTRNDTAWMRRWMKVIHVASHYGDFSSEILNCSSHSSEGCSNTVVYSMNDLEMGNFFFHSENITNLRAHIHIFALERWTKWKLENSVVSLCFIVSSVWNERKKGQKVTQLLVACITKAHKRLFAIAGDECEKWRMLCSNFVMYISIHKLHDGWDR